MPQLVDFIKLLFLDVRKVVMLDCWDIGGFYGKIVRFQQYLTFAPN